MMIFQVPATLTSFRPLKDRSVSLSFVSTIELNPEEQLTALKFYNTSGWLLFKEAEFQESEIPEDDPTDNPKSPSERLRAVLFVLWQKTGKQAIDFDTFYKHEMDRIINGKKKLLED